MDENVYRIEVPERNLPAALLAALGNYQNDDSIMKAVAEAQARYLPWDQFRYKNWIPGDKGQVWSLVKLLRSINNVKSPIRDDKDEYFKFDPRSHVQFLHEVDLELGGSFLGIEDFAESDKRRFIKRNLIEEAIASSQLEGANTSREVAKKMLKEGRPPRTHGEHMIVNNHETMQWIEGDLKNDRLSIDLLMELHRRITRNTIDERFQGVLRNTLDEHGNKLVVKPWDNITVAYVAPDREFVEKELPRLLAFANDDDGGSFIHPIFKAIMIHFWLALLHPFEDGNGRLARILFYWYLLRKQYWAFSYLSISEKIKKSSNQYSMAFVYSEQDDNDMNYFIWYSIAKIKLARKDFEKYVRTRMSENREKAKIIRMDNNLNERQIDLIQYLAKDDQKYTTLAEYSNINSHIGKVTAVMDLKRLVESDFLNKIRKGRNVYYHPTKKVYELLGK
jgi:Fic family protein